MRGLYFVLPVRKQAMSDDHSQKRPQDTSGIRDVQLLMPAQSAESLAEKVRKTLGKEIAARL
jgi:hypothetical protein